VWEPDTIAKGKRIERMNKDTPDEPAPASIAPGRRPDREALVRDYMTMGRSRQQAEDLYDRQTAEWEARRHDTH
jgi:hypothetical protein